MANKHIRRMRPAQLFSSSSSSSSSLHNLKSPQQQQQQPNFNNTHYHQFHPHYLHRHKSNTSNNNSSTNSKTAGMRQIINCFPLHGSDAGGYQGDDEDEDIMAKPISHHGQEHHHESHAPLSMDGDDTTHITHTNWTNPKRKRVSKQLLHRSHSCSKLKLMPSFKSLLSHHHKHSGSLENIYKCHTCDDTTTTTTNRLLSNVPYKLHHVTKLDSNELEHKLHHKNGSNKSLAYTRSRSLPSLNKIDEYAFLQGNSPRQHNHRVNTPKGHVAIYVNYGTDRFVVPIPYLSHPNFQQLLLQAQDEFGFRQKAGLVLPCSTGEFQDVVSSIHSPHSDPRSLGGKHHHNANPTKLIHQCLHNTFSKSNLDKSLSKGSSHRLAWSHSDASPSSSPSSRGKGA